MRHAQYFLGSNWLGRSIRSLPPEADSIAYACQQCGEIWGRIVVEGSTFFHIVVRPCEAHSPSTVKDWGERHRQGLFHWWNTDENSTSLMFHAAIPTYFPELVLRREVLILFEHRDRRST